LRYQQGVTNINMIILSLCYFFIVNIMINLSSTTSGDRDISTAWWYPYTHMHDTNTNMMIAIQIASLCINIITSKYTTTPSYHHHHMIFMNDLLLWIITSLLLLHILTWILVSCIMFWVIVVRGLAIKILEDIHKIVIVIYY
jgi:hypothetical protein